MTHFYNVEAPKKPTNVSINSDLLSQARSLKINLSATLEQALTEQLRTQRRAQWRQENASAIQAYNDHVEKNGTFSESVRKF
jgi:antitoxin CcdA